MKKQTNKTKITKKIQQKKKRQKCLCENIYFEVILMIILIPIFSFFVLSVLNKNESNFTNKIIKDSKDVRILTDKNIYGLNDEIVLIVKNNSGEPVYFEPCEFLNNFEKKVNGKWVAENKIMSNNIYNEHAFDKKDNVIKCEIDLPQSGKGIYRSVVSMYYNCGKPGYDTCRSSEVFYSNEFEVTGDKNDFCEDRILENCDGKKVSVIGTFITSKAHFLSEIENREVKYQWAGEIMIDNSKGMKEGERYKVIGIVRKGGQLCGMNNEQCMLDEKGVVLPYPTRIEVEKIYSIK
ncbi:MAG: hypothetical protein KAQ64_03955 [Candidatus Pacebacteria bacterium]|nr:hypothetical protein [Candidatus Paceibacterota bacterium]